MKFPVGSRIFPSKDAAKKHFSALRKSGKIGPEDQILLRGLIDLHRKRDAKVGCGIKEFFIASDGSYGNQCFWIRRTDGTEVWFSFNQCIAPSNDRTEATSAFREEVKDQIFSFRDFIFKQADLKCAITGVPITRIDDVHVDHAPPRTFSALLDQFLTAEGLQHEDVESVAGKIPGNRRLTDRNLAARWQVFHRENAHFQITTAQANMKQGAGRKMVASL